MKKVHRSGKIMALLHLDVIRDLRGEVSDLQQQTRSQFRYCLRMEKAMHHPMFGANMGKPISNLKLVVFGFQHVSTSPNIFIEP
jgi:hypothetical protein